MAYQFNSFENRLNRIGRTHKRLANGFTPIVGSDGLISIRPRRRRPHFPVRGVVILVLGFLVFKAIMLAHFGMEGYAERVSKLNSGTILEQAGAWVMQPDRATVWIAGHLNSIIR